MTEKQAAVLGGAFGETRFDQFFCLPIGIEKVLLFNVQTLFGTGTQVLPGNCVICGIVI